MTNPTNRVVVTTDRPPSQQRLHKSLLHGIRGIVTTNGQTPNQPRVVLAEHRIEPRTAPLGLVHGRQRATRPDASVNALDTPQRPRTFGMTRRARPRRLHPRRKVAPPRTELMPIGTRYDD